MLRIYSDNGQFRAITDNNQLVSFSNIGPLLMSEGIFSQHELAMLGAFSVLLVLNQYVDEAYHPYFNYDNVDKHLDAWYGLEREQNKPFYDSQACAMTVLKRCIRDGESLSATTERIVLACFVQDP